MDERVSGHGGGRGGGVDMAVAGMSTLMLSKPLFGIVRRVFVCTERTHKKRNVGHPGMDGPAEGQLLSSPLLFFFLVLSKELFKVFGWTDYPGCVATIAYMHLNCRRYEHGP